MALSQVYTAVTNDTITAARWNNEFGNIYNNGTDVAFPLTKAVSAGSFNIQSLADPVSAQDAATKNYVDLYGPELAVCEFRLTLTTVTPVTTGDVTGATTLYCTPYKGNKIKLYDGSLWKTRSSAEFSIAVPATTDTNYDVFCYDNAGTPTLELTAWTNATTRATALALQNGVLSKTGALTRRYLGSFRTTGVSGQTEDSVAKRYVWNYYNRVRRAMRVVEGTNTWTYTLDAYQQASASAANQLDYVQGVSEDAVYAVVIAGASNNNASVAIGVGVGVDSTTVNSAQAMSTSQTQVIDTNITVTAEYRGWPGVGRHTLVWLERSAATGITTWRGDNGGTIWQSGITGEVWG
jgi:hypothetical protein